MEKRKTLILFNIILFIFLSTFVLSEKLNISGNRIINNEEAIVATSQEIKVNDNKESLSTTTTTIPTLEDSYEQELQTNINFKLPDSDGDLFNCSIIKEPLYDPSGQKMRS